MPRLQLSPSILTADWGRIGDEIHSVADYVDWFHLDVMDGHYVDNLTFGPRLVEAVRAACDQPLHVHLMITDPARFARAFVDAGATRISFHPEVTQDVGAVIDVITTAGAGAGLAVHPDIPVETVTPHLGAIEVVLMMTVRPGFGGQEFLTEVVPKISQARSMVEETASNAEIEVDGGVNLQTVERAVEAGGEVLVAGSAIFDGKDPRAAARRMRERLDSLASVGT